MMLVALLGTGGTSCDTSARLTLTGALLKNVWSRCVHAVTVQGVYWHEPCLSWSDRCARALAQVTALPTTLLSLSADTILTLMFHT